MPATVHVDSNRTWGGGQAQSLGLALALAERGEKTCFIAQTGSELAKRLPSTGLPWEGISLRGIKGAWRWRDLSKRFRLLEPDIVHAHDSAAQLPVAWAAGRLTAGRFSRRKPRVVVTRRTEFRIGHGYRGQSYDLLCDRVICVSEAVRKRMLEASVPAGRLVVIPDFVDCHHFHPAAAPPRADSRPTIAAVGRLSGEKGHAVLLQATASLVRRLPEARLVICGQGVEEAELRKQTGSARLSSQVQLLGFVEDVRPVLAGADVFVMPSLSEGLGVAVLEAMAMGLPVVASNTGGLPEAVVEGETGLLVPPGNAEALADALISLLTDSDRARAMGEAGRRRALSHYDRGPVVDRVLALYHEVLTEG